MCIRDSHEAMVVAGLAALTPNVVVIMAQIRMDCLAGSAAWGDGRGRDKNGMHGTNFLSVARMFGLRLLSLTLCFRIQIM